MKCSRKYDRSKWHLDQSKWVSNGFGTITVNNGGVFNNQLSIDNRSNVIINDGGIFNNQLSAVFTNSGFTPPYTTLGTLTINSGGVFNNNGTAVVRAGNLVNSGTINNQSSLVGNATITGSITNSGTVAPGNSPGTYTVSGDYTASSTAVHNFELGGMTTGNYDKLSAGGVVTLNGTLNVSLINGFNPTTNHDIPIITANTVNGMFTSVTKPAKYAVVYTSNSVVMRYLVTLPVTYTNLQIKNEGGGARLIWTVSNEKDVARYEIEKSNTGADFTKIGQVYGASLTEYGFTDSRPGEKSFYRIKSIDRDGKFSYSIVLTYNGGKGVIELHAFPSPAKNNLIVQHSTATAASKINVLSVDGRTLQVIYPAGDMQQTTISLTGLKAGIYFIKYENGKEPAETIKIIKE